MPSSWDRHIILEIQYLQQKLRHIILLNGQECYECDGDGLVDCDDDEDEDEDGELQKCMRCDGLGRVPEFSSEEDHYGYLDPCAQSDYNEIDNRIKRLKDLLSTDWIKYLEGRGEPPELYGHENASRMEVFYPDRESESWIEWIREGESEQKDKTIQEQLDIICKLEDERHALLHKIDKQADDLSVKYSKIRTLRAKLDLVQENLTRANQDIEQQRQAIDLECDKVRERDRMFGERMAEVTKMYENKIMSIQQENKNQQDKLKSRIRTLERALEDYDIDIDNEEIVLLEL